MFFLGTALCYIDRVSISVAIIPLAHQYGYNSAAQGLVLSAFFWGYVWLQMGGGWMADRFGGHRVLAAGVALWSIATIMTPPAAATSFAALLAARVALGLGEGVNFPAVHSLTARWMPPSEHARVLALNFSAMSLGTTVALALSPIIIAAFGWPALFYISGGIGALWVVAWWMTTASRPEDSHRISAAELEMIVARRAAQPHAESVPWNAIVREKAVWAIVAAHFCSNFGFNILLLWMPTYLNHTFHVPLEHVGSYALIPWIATFATVNCAGWFSDWMRANGAGVGNLRKAMQGTAFALGAAPLIALPLASSPGAAVAMLTISAAANGIGLAAYGVNHLDVGPTYAGILMGISNSIATLAGTIGVAAAGFIAQSTGSFSAVFRMIAAVYCAGMIVYIAWGSGERKL